MLTVRGFAPGDASPRLPTGSGAATMPHMSHPRLFASLCVACLAGIFSGVLLSGPSDTLWRGEECREAIERLKAAKPVV